MYVPPEVYVALQDNLRLADITAMHVEEFNFFALQTSKIPNDINGNDCTNVQQQFDCLM